MTLITNIGLKTGHINLNWVKTAKRDFRKIIYKQAGHIGILLPVNSEEDILSCSQIINDLQVANKKFNVLGYGDYVITNNNNTPIHLLNKRDLNLDYLPKKEKIKTFLSAEYDILINLCTEMCLPLANVTAKSKSHFKIDKYHPNLAKYYDLMIDSHEVSLNGFLKEVKDYLLKIK